MLLASETVLGIFHHLASTDTQGLYIIDTLYSSMHAREHRANGETCLKVWLSTLWLYCAPEQYGPEYQEN